MAKAKDLSKSDTGQIFKHVHDDDARALRVTNANSQVPAGYSKVNLTTNANGSVTKAAFYKGEETGKFRIKTVADVGGSLNNTYFLISSPEDDPDFYVWYNVDNTGTDPQIANRCGLEIPISANDPDVIVAMATKLVFRNSEQFDVTYSSDNSITIENSLPGETTPAVDINTGFDFVNVRTGTTKLIKSIELPFANENKYVFNHAEGKFEVVPSVSGEFVLVGLENPTPIVELAVNDSGWTPVTVTVPPGKTVAVDIQNTSSVQVKLNYINDPSITAGMVIYPNGGERRYVFKKNGAVIYLRSVSGNVTVNIEVIS